MRALTVQQPWAWAIVEGGKDVENRTQAWSYRGTLAIHAGMRWSDRGAAHDLIARRFPSIIPRGAIVGLVELVDVHPEAGGCCGPWGESSYVEHGGRTRKVIYHLVLEDPRALARPVPCRGFQGLWTPAAEVLAEITRRDVHA